MTQFTVLLLVLILCVSAVGGYLLLGILAEHLPGAYTEIVVVAVAVFLVLSAAWVAGTLWQGDNK